MVSKGRTQEEQKAIEKIMTYVHDMKDEELIQPVQRSKLIEELMIDNPYVIDLV